MNIPIAFWQELSKARTVLCKADSHTILEQDPKTASAVLNRNKPVQSALVLYFSQTTSLTRPRSQRTRSPVAIQKHANTWPIPVHISVILIHTAPPCFLAFFLPCYPYCIQHHKPKATLPPHPPLLINVTTSTTVLLYFIYRQRI